LKKKSLFKNIADINEVDKKDLSQILDKEIPLSMMEDCYISVFSVAKFYILNTVEPSRTLNTVLTKYLKQNEQTNDVKKPVTVSSSFTSLHTDTSGNQFTVHTSSSCTTLTSTQTSPPLPSTLMIECANNNLYFDVCSADSFRLLGDCLDMLQILVKFYIEIGRYRDATGFLKEGLDMAQVHCSKRRCVPFLLNQIHADIIALCFTEAQERLALVKNFLQIDQKTTQIAQEDLFEEDDLMQLKNFIHMHYLELLNEIKKAGSKNTWSPSRGNTIYVPDVSVKDLIVSKTTIIRNLLNKNKKLNDLAKDILLDTCLISINYLIHFSSSKSAHKQLLIELLKYIKSYLLTSSSELLSSHGKWHLADYYCCLYDLDEIKFKDYLKLALDLLVTNPHPTIYRRVLTNLFYSVPNSESDDMKKIFYLLEHQSIALRHKSYAIHMKHRRKNTMNTILSAKFTEAIQFTPNLDPSSLKNMIENSLPKNLSILALILLPEKNDLYLVRLEKSCRPMLIKFSFHKRILDDFRWIMTENDKSMKCLDRNKFWSMRNQLNKKLAQFLTDLEVTVFGEKKYLMLGSYLDYDLDTLCEEFKNEFRLGIINLSAEKELLLKNLILGIEFYSSDDIKSTLKSIYEKYYIDSYYYYFADKLKAKLLGAKRKHACLLLDKVSLFILYDLKLLLILNIIFYIKKNLHQIPWETMPCTTNQLITRMPSIHFLQTHLTVNSFHINKESAYYIVDPGSDLHYTREKFSNFFQKRKKWEGIVGVAPNESQYKKALTEYDLFIYTGHGSGSQYYPSDEVQKLRVQATSILMGCSSGNQYVMGEFEPYGTVLSYILAGCPCIVGNLWDVTDRDIDRLTEEFLDSWIADNEQNKIEKDARSICIHLNKSRKACKMDFLNGSAPVVFGLPVNFK
jgi:hypothetical protein